ncbi:unnamed protein product, partial [Ilex paraguariensis]
MKYGMLILLHLYMSFTPAVYENMECVDNEVNLVDHSQEQILQAVNTIHEERKVHSDPKPANFLLVQGSLKLIDFGIAKAIMSDSTDIQRDSQFGKISANSEKKPQVADCGYTELNACHQKHSRCNETVANGNTIKCSRPLDIWSPGLHPLPNGIWKNAIFR